jgi:hypothetical protein
MPLPNPKKNEKKSEFVSRCTGELSDPAKPGSKDRPSNEAWKKAQE